MLSPRQPPAPVSGRTLPCAATYSRGLNG